LSSYLLTSSPVCVLCVIAYLCKRSSSIVSERRWEERCGGKRRGEEEKSREEEEEKELLKDRGERVSSV